MLKLGWGHTTRHELSAGLGSTAPGNDKKKIGNHMTLISAVVLHSGELSTKQTYLISVFDLGAYMKFLTYMYIIYCH